MQGRIPLVAALLTLAALPGAQDATGEAGQRAPRLHALLVGVSEYPHLREAFGEERYASTVRLTGPSNDVELVRTTLTRVLGLEQASTLALTGWQEAEETRPTRKNILGALADLARTVIEKDRVIVFLAGHGSQQRIQRAKDDEPDGMDEVFLPADARPGKDGWIPNAIRDDELGAALRAIRDAGAEVWLIVDACHSGSMLRGASGAGVRVRGLDPAQLGVSSGLRGGARQRHERSGWIRDDSSTRIAVLYGAQSYGRAPEMPTPRGAEEVHGLFTYLLCQELERSAGRSTYHELSERVVAAYQAFPCSITIPGAEGDLLREVASGASVEGPRLLCSLRGETPWLNQGRLAGLDSGTIATLSLDGDGDGDGDGSERVLARVEVLEADPFQARCRWLPQEGQAGQSPAERDPALVPGSVFPAAIERRGGADWRLALAFVSQDGSALPAEAVPARVAAVLRDSDERLRLVPPGVADWWIVIAAEERLWLRPGPGEGGFDLLDVRAETLARTLRRIQVTRNLRRCTGDLLEAGWTRELDVWIERKDGRGQAQRLQPGDVLHPLDEIRIRLSKSGARIWDVHVFYLDAGFARKPLFPPRGVGARLPAEAQTTIELVPWTTVVDDALGFEQLLVLATPREPASPVLDLSWLEGESALRGSGGALAAVLAAAQRGQDLRGSGFGVSDEVNGTQSLLIPLRTWWRSLAPPEWPRGKRIELTSAALDGRPAKQGSAAIPDPWASCTQAVLTRAPVRGNRELDVLLLGDDGVLTLMFDLDGDAHASARSVARREFEAEAVFIFAPGERTAFYASRSSDLDTLLVDRDGDGVADERRILVQGVWSAAQSVAVPWLSQAHLLPDSEARPEERAARFGMLQASP